MVNVGVSGQEDRTGQHGLQEKDPLEEQRRPQHGQPATAAGGGRRRLVPEGETIQGIF